MEHQVKQIIALYKVEKEEFDSMETESAPSGEWEEYNYHYMIQENRVEVLENVLDLLGVDYGN